MRVACFTKVDDTDAARVFECTGFEHNTHGAYKHEVILHHAKVVQGAASPEEEKVRRHVLVEIDGGDRQAAGPLRFARVVIDADGPVSAPVAEEGPVYEQAIDGRVGVRPSAPAVHEVEPPEVPAAEPPSNQNGVATSGQANNETEQQP
jgi:hypothetical protein